MMTMTAEMMATVLAGILAVPVLQLFKRLTHVSGTSMAFAAYFISWPIAAISLVTMTDLTWSSFFASPETLMLHGSAVAALATLTYRIVAEKMGLSSDGETTKKK